MKNGYRLKKRLNFVVLFGNSSKTCHKIKNCKATKRILSTFPCDMYQHHSHIVL